MSEAGDANLSSLAKAMEPFNGAELTEAFRDQQRIERFREDLLEIASPDLVTVMVGSAGGGLSGTFAGHDGFIEGWRDFLDTFESFRNDIEEFIEVDPDTILILSRQRATTATGGVEMDNEAAAIFRFDHGQLREIEFHLDREAAAKAAGLEPR
jgi:hypothetical protein